MSDKRGSVERIVAVEDVPPGTTCCFCEQGNDESFSQPFITKALDLDGIIIRPWAHVGCAADYAYDAYQSQAELDAYQALCDAEEAINASAADWIAS